MNVGCVTIVGVPGCFRWPKRFQSVMVAKNLRGGTDLHAIFEFELVKTLDFTDCIHGGIISQFNASIALCDPGDSHSPAA